jgi:predicted nucleic acid-binding protein
VILDAGFLVSVDRGERVAQEFLAAAVRHNTPLHSTEPVIAQVWRAGSRQTRLARFLGAIAVHPLDDGRTVGAILARSGTTDVVDAHLVSVAIRTGEPILTADVGDIGRIAAALPDERPRVHRWP